MTSRYPRRKSTRLMNYDYSHSGRYFITICTYGRSDCLGRIEDGIMLMNPCGEIVFCCIDKIANLHSNLHILSKAVMPDHIHFILEIIETSSVGVAYHATRPPGDTTRPLANTTLPPENTTCSQENIDGLHENGGHRQDHAVHPNNIGPSDDTRRKSKMTVPKIVQQFKAATLKAVRLVRERYEAHRLIEGWLYGDGLHDILPPLYWQRGYYDRIIRTVDEYEILCEYIVKNPQNWSINEHLGEYAQASETPDRPL